MTHAFTTDSLASTASVTAVVGDATAAPISAEEEGTLVLAAQAGDDDATLALMRQYGPALRKAVARRAETLPAEDAEQEATLALLSLIKVHDPSTGRLAGRVQAYLAEGLAEAASKAGTWSIPARTVKRFLSIVKRSNGDLREAYDLVLQGGVDMDSLTFLAVARSLRGTGSIEALAEQATTEGSTSAEAGFLVTGEQADPYAAVTDSILATGLLALLDERETVITRIAYGFDDLPASIKDPKEGTAKTREEGVAVANDGVIARHLGMSRATVQRTRKGALATMRAAASGDAA